MVLIVTLVLAGAVFAGRQILSDEPPPPLSVRVVGAGPAVSVEVSDGSSIADVLDEANLTLVDGRLLSAAEGAVLDPVHDPAELWLNGTAASPETVLRRGTALTIRVDNGEDTTEGVVTEEVEVPIPTTAAATRFILEGGSPGRERRTLGSVSGEVVTTETLVPAQAPLRTERKVVALTFDDGPTARWTPYILAILADRGVTATFCVVGDTVRQNPELAQRIVDEGHTLCNHSLSHDLNMVGAPQALLDEQIHGMNTLMDERGLPVAAFYRPPGGLLSDEIVATVAAADQRVLMWKVDTRDWSSTSTPESVMAALWEQVEPGAVILMHDGGGRDRTLSVSVLGPLIDALRDEGYEFALPFIPAGS